MQFRFFSIPANDIGAAADELNAFLRGHRILSVRRELLASRNFGMEAMDGPVSGSNRVLRGGAWNNDASNARCSYRNNNYGFRTVRSSERSPQRGHDSDPAALPPAPSHPAWQNGNARPVPVGAADAAPKAPGVAAVFYPRKEFTR